MSENVKIKHEEAVSAVLNHDHPDKKKKRFIFASDKQKKPYQRVKIITKEDGKGSVQDVQIRTLTPKEIRAEAQIPSKEEAERLYMERQRKKEIELGNKVKE